MSSIPPATRVTPSRTAETRSSNLDNALPRRWRRPTLPLDVLATSARTALLWATFAYSCRGRSSMSPTASKRPGLPGRAAPIQCSREFQFYVSAVSKHEARCTKHALPSSDDDVLDLD